MLTSSTILPSRDAILHNASKKSKLISILCEDSVTNNILLINKQNCSVSHCEADNTLCSYMWKAHSSHSQSPCPPSVLGGGEGGINTNIQMEKWNGDVFDINKIRLFVSWDQGSVVSFLEGMFYMYWV